ncbi:histidinol-phosphatase [Streptomyces glebosus]|uniref:Histidinol-phosphatase n=1 Tax=Streptomyces glebosus TaxID=249580 RepID=A0A640SWM5_9ACTN|nr:inositol monophosphatase family protein [Streptomyces glebosus]GFE13825.1 histidinol-phosphatase [Streptomyces glebosus]GHG82367.1 histidinol-phosphatase [Streptomyces glebosus]
MESDSDVLLAHRLVDLSDELALRYFQQDVPSQEKADGSPVSEADLAVEKAMLEVLAAERPRDSVLSEESGADERGKLSVAPRRWILDPIDGTVPFLAGRRAWGTHVALEVDGELRIGVVSRPTEGKRWWARHCSGAYASTADSPLSTARRVRIPATVTALRRARVGGFLFPGSPVEAIRDRMCWVGESPVSLVADLLEGRVDAVIDEGGHVWDRAPAALLVQEAGGHVDDLRGGRRIDQPWLVYTAHGIARELTGLLKNTVG